MPPLFSSGPANSSSTTLISNAGFNPLIGIVKIRYCIAWMNQFIKNYPVCLIEFHIHNWEQSFEMFQGTWTNDRRSHARLILHPQ